METIKNKKASFNFSFEQSYECGIVLEGWEVKPILQRQVNLENSHVIIKNGELYLLNAIITPHKNTNKSTNSISDRSRKLLLKKSEINKLIGSVQQKGYTLVITQIYNKGNKIKCTLALAKGKKEFDKREVIKEREAKINASAAMKHDISIKN